MFTEETRRSETRNRHATITQHNYPNKYFTITMVEKGRLITRERREEAKSLKAARKLSRAWCV